MSLDRSQQKEGAESPREIAGRLGLPISDYFLLSRALTHRSYLNENTEAVEDNERLEFLGDAVLDFLVGAWLYHRYPEMSEGQLTRLRSALVRTEQLANFAQELGLGPAMRLGRGEAESGGRTRPTLLCATFEALIGAMYLDSGIPPVQEFLEKLLEPAAEKILLARRFQDPKSYLQEWAQSQGHAAPTYRTLSEIGPDHAKVFEVEVLIDDRSFGRGTGQSKQAATKDAAREALKTFGVE